MNATSPKKVEVRPHTTGDDRGRRLALLDALASDAARHVRQDVTAQVGTGTFNQPSSITGPRRIPSPLQPHKGSTVAAGALSVADTAW